RSHQHPWMREQCTTDISPVIRIGGIPLNCFLQSLFPWCALCPSQSLQLLIIQEVPLVIEGPVLNKPDDFLSIQAKEPAYVLGHINHPPLLHSTNVIHMSILSFVKNHLKS